MEIKTFKSLKELRAKHKEDVERWHNEGTVSDIFETDISFSYRVFYKNGNTMYFKHYLKR